MLIPSHRHTAEDLAQWGENARGDILHGNRPAMSKRMSDAIRCVQEFADAGPCYCSVSWGKDSVAVAELVSLSGWHIPLVWIKVDPVANPDCDAVRDAFLSCRNIDYHEIVVKCRRDRHGWHATGTLEAGFKEAVKRFGKRHISGLRANESAGRSISCATDGKSTKNSCRPLAWWGVEDVMGFLALRNLPVHPAYAMLGGGRWERDHIRVASLGGKRGDGFGRAQWESEYYGDVLRRLECSGHA